MSRCFPYPPPGYEENGIRDEALVESIKKLQREGEKARKDKKKERKQKKREKKEKDKAREHGGAGKEKHSHKKRHKDERGEEVKKGRDHDKKRELETENLEKSNLTEEHGQPVGSQNSSDSTLNSNKRHKPSSPPESCHNSGSIIRIRLPLQRHKDPEILPSKEQPCSASGRTHNAFVQGTCDPGPRQIREQGEQHPCSTSTRGASQEVENSRLGKEKDLPKTKSVDLSQKPELISMPSTSTRRRPPPPPPIVSQFRDLFENWAPSPIQCMESGDETWLFESKQNRNAVERCRDGSDVSSYEPSTLWPRAQFLPSADIYALPYAAMF